LPLGAGGTPAGSRDAARKSGGGRTGRRNKGELLAAHDPTPPHAAGRHTVGGTHEVFRPETGRWPGWKMAAVQGAGVAGEARAHTPGERTIARPDQEMGVVRQEGSGVDSEGSLLRQAGEARREVGAVLLVPEEARALDPPSHYVVQDPGSIEAGCPGDGRTQTSTSRPGLQRAPLQ
jgi:hypothetical protein